MGLGCIRGGEFDEERMLVELCVCFFFQAEDGIRGVRT